MAEYNKKDLKLTLSGFEPEDIATLSDLLKDLNEFNQFSNITLEELINTIDLVIEENENSELSKIKEELNKKYLNKYIKYSDGDDTIILKKVVNILVDPAFGGSDFAIRFISTQAIYENKLSLEFKVFFDDADESCKPIVMYSDLENVTIIDEKDYYGLLEKNSINIKKCP